MVHHRAVVGASPAARTPSRIAGHRGFHHNGVHKPSNLLEFGFRAKKKGVSRSLCGEFEQQRHRPSPAFPRSQWQSNRALAVSRAPLAALHQRHRQQLQHHHQQPSCSGRSEEGARPARGPSAFQLGHIAATCDMHVDCCSARKPTPIPQHPPPSGSAARRRELEALAFNMSSMLTIDGADLDAGAHGLWWKQSSAASAAAL